MSLGAGVLLWSLFTILTPPAAALGLTVLLVARVAMGMGEAVTFPSIYSLYSRWVPTQERSRSIAFTNSGIPLGTVFALIVTPMIVTRFGWEWAFYSFGLVGGLWYLLWIRMVKALQPRRHSPQRGGTRGDSPWRPRAEAAPSPPWREL